MRFFTNECFTHWTYKSYTHTPTDMHARTHANIHTNLHTETAISLETLNLWTTINSLTLRTDMHLNVLYVYFGSTFWWEQILFFSEKEFFSFFFCNVVLLIDSQVGDVTCNLNLWQWRRGSCWCWWDWQGISFSHKKNFKE